MGRNTKINIAIVTVSTITTFLQALFLSVSDFYSHISIQIVNAVLSATIVALESFQLNIKRLKSRENSRRNSSDLTLDEEVQIEVEASTQLRSTTEAIKDLSTEVGEK